MVEVTEQTLGRTSMRPTRTHRQREPAKHVALLLPRVGDDRRRATE